ncbi:MAG: asparagine--tRNA ligase [Mycoplasmatales bacterium]
MIIKQLDEKYQEYAGQEVEIKGWVRNHRIGKNISFLMINDGTCFTTVQVVYKELANLEAIKKLHIGSAVKISGLLKDTSGKKQNYELEAQTIEILANSEEDYPLQPKKHTREFLREIAHLRPRTNTFNAVFKIRSELSYALHKFFNENNFLYVHTPIITGADAEGAGEMFQVNTLDLKNIPMQDGEVDYSKEFFNKSVNLTVSGQLLAESFALAFQNVYTFGPTFRAENSNTTRHAAEFWMLEPEVAFAELDDIISLSKEMLIDVIKHVLEKCTLELQFLNTLVEYDLIQRLEDLVKANFIELDYQEAIKILEQAVASGQRFDNKVEYGIDLATEHERYLTDIKYQAPVYVKNYPKDIKAFYMRLNDDKQTVAATDLLVPGIGELIGGSQREERIDILKELMAVHKLSEEEYDWYLELRKFGGVKHSGFGIGFERLVMYVTGIENIRDVLPFPRTVKNCKY